MTYVHAHTSLICTTTAGWISAFHSYTEQGLLGRMDEWNKEFITGRGVALDAFLLDDGWDDLTGRWLFGTAFRNGFSKVREKADSLHSLRWAMAFTVGWLQQTARRSRFACKRVWVRNRGRQTGAVGSELL